MSPLNPYINFAGNCRDAMRFYQECLGGELNLQTVGESPIAQQCPAAMQHQVVHSTLTRGELLLMGSDMTGPEGTSGGRGNAVALSLNCSSEEEINTLFAALSAGGQILDPLGVKFWGGVFGVINDRFGVRWMFNYDQQPPA
jgi:PhnB protein